MQKINRRLWTGLYVELHTYMYNSYLYKVKLSYMYMVLCWVCSFIGTDRSGPDQKHSFIGTVGIGPFRVVIVY
jgi:hypothetical protein